MQQIAPHVYVETGYPPITVGAILTQDGWVVIDTPPMPNDAQKWRQALADISDKPIQYLINTDAQRERILGNVWFETTLIAQEAAAAQMLALKGTFLAQAADEMSSNDNELVAIASLRLIPPHVSYGSALTLYCGQHEISLLHRPGASFGNSWVLLPAEKVLFTGDSLITNQYPAIGDGISKAWLQSLSELRDGDYAGWTLVPGRGNPTDVGAAESLMDTLIGLRQHVSSIVKAGRARSEIAPLAAELISQFGGEANQRDDLHRRVRSALESVYDEMRSVTTPDESESL